LFINNFFSREFVENLWKEGRYIDWWAAVHLIAGSTLGIIFRLIEVPIRLAITIVFSLLVFWEIFERLLGITEMWQNRVIDIIIGLSGFIIGYYSNRVMSKTASIFLLLILVFLLIILNVVGWRAYYK